MLEARREALRRAAALAKDDQFRPLTFPGMTSTTDFSCAHEPRQSAGERSPAQAPPAARAARQIEVRRVVDTIDNRGSLIDLLL